jgi:type II secretory pathway component PulM
MKRINLMGGTVVLMLASIILLAWLVPSWHRHQLIRQSVPIQQALENYRQQHGSHPESLSAAKIQDRRRSIISASRTALMFSGLACGLASP